jgi:serine protease Do
MSRAVAALTLVFVALVSGLVGLLAGGGGGVSTVPRASAPALAWPSFSDIVARANPAVVHIAVAEVAPDIDTELGRLPGWNGPRRGEGSGFVIDPDGYIVTNHHVVATSTRIRVRLTDKRDLPAQLVGVDPNTDLALLKVDGGTLPSLTLGNSEEVRVGDWVCAIGNPYRFEHSVTVGVVSSKGRKIWDASFDSYIQTDAAINPGNSGGPLINAAGKVVGINSAMVAQAQGIGFAIPVSVAARVITQLRDRGRVSRGYLGIQLQEMEPALQKLVGMSDSKGAVVLDVLKGGAGEAAGLKRYDVITEVSDDDVTDGDHLVQLISSHTPGSSITLTVFREGRRMTLDARLDEREPVADPASRQTQPAAKKGEEDLLGLEIVELSPTMRGELSIPADRAGVVIRDVVTLAPGADALAHGDIIVEINRRPTPDKAAYKRVVAALRPGDAAWLYVYRPTQTGTFLARIDVER